MNATRPRKVMKAPLPAEMHNGTVLIIEPNPHGHRLYYVALLAAQAESRGNRVVIATSRDAPSTNEWSIHLGQRSYELIFLTHAGWTEYEDAAASVHAVVTVVPDADNFLGRLVRSGWRGPGQLNVLAMRADAQAGGPATRWAKGSIKKLRIVLANLRPRVNGFALRSPLEAKGDLVRWVSDPVTLRPSREFGAEIVSALRDGQSRYWFGVFGAISDRKNLPLILRSLAGMEGVGLLVAGVVNSEVRAEVDEARRTFVGLGGAYIELAGPLKDDEFDAAVVAVDCVVAAHTNEGPSGVVAKGARAGKRLVLAGARSLRRDAEALPGQATWCRLDIAELQTSLCSAVDTPVSTAGRQLDETEFLWKMLLT